jgi:hypothetical protein
MREIILALLAIIVVGLDMYTNLPQYNLPLRVWAVFVLLLFEMLALFIETNKIKNARPSLRLINTNFEPITFWVYTTQSQEKKRKASDIAYSMRSTAAPPQVTLSRPGYIVEDNTKHNVAFAAIENPNIRSRIGVTARNVSAKIAYFSENGKKCIDDIDGRWWDETEPKLLSVNQPPKYLTTTIIAPGTTAILAIAEHLHGDRILFAYNAKSHDYDTLRNPGFELGNNKYYARIQLAADDIKPPEPMWISLKTRNKQELDVKIEKPNWAK